MNNLKVLHIDTKNYKEMDERGKTHIHFLNDSIKNGKHVFLLIYMEGCEPCNKTRPEWKKIGNVLKDNMLNNVLVVDIDKDLFDKVNNIGTSPKGFPTIRYISNKGKTTEDFEDCELSEEDKNRTIDSFVKWIHLKSKKDATGGKRRIGGKRLKGGKWTQKYKKSINCKRPKGFSQKQYCKYSRKKH